jgi:hypothetical protein
MTATNEQIIEEAQRRFDGNPGFESLSLIHYAIEVTREGWKPADPVLLLAREFLAQAQEKRGYGNLTDLTRKGYHDTGYVIEAIMNAYNTGRTLVVDIKIGKGQQP